MTSSASPTHGGQKGTAYNSRFGCTCYDPLFAFNQFGDTEGGGKSAAIAYTLIETAKLNAINPHAWLTDVPGRIADYKITCLDELIPWRYGVAAAVAETSDGAPEHLRRTVTIRLSDHVGQEELINLLALVRERLTVTPLDQSGP